MTFSLLSRFLSFSSITNIPSLQRLGLKESSVSHALQSLYLPRINRFRWLPFLPTTSSSDVNNASSQLHGKFSDADDNHYKRLQKLRAIHRKYVSVPEYVVASHYTPPRYTIVLCHGLFGYDKRNLNIGFLPVEFHYWTGIREALEKLGAKVVVARVPRTGSIQERAEALANMMETVCAGERINFVAHSMGGLDCRHLIAHIKDRSYTIASLTTLATPHRGSPFMDWCRDQFGVGVHRVWKEPEPDSGLQKLKNQLLSCVDTPAYANLTTDYVRNYFNPITPDDPSVDYFSYGAAYPINILSPLRIPYEIVHRPEGKNDGLVSISSAKWGQYLGTVEADHWDLVNTWGVMGKLGKPIGLHPWNPRELYLEIATKLYHEGH